MAKKIYAVKKGLITGVFYNWDECKESVNGYPGAIYKGFTTLEDAKAFLEETNVSSHTGAKKKSNSVNTKSEKPYAFVDGSFNANTNVYGYGGFLINKNKRFPIQGSDNEPDMVSMRNVAGEIAGSMAAIKKAIELNIPELDIYYDYLGIEKWATGEWKRNKPGTIAYYDYIHSVHSLIQLNFKKVKGHSGVKGNEEADKLAKKAVGIL